MKGISWVTGKVKAGVAYVKGKAKAGVAKLKAKFGKKDKRTPVERKAALDAAMTEGQDLLKDKKLDEKGVRAKLASIKRARKVKKLNLVIDSKSETSETVHILGANSPTVHSAKVTRVYLPVAQRTQEGDEVTETSASTDIAIGGEPYLTIVKTNVSVQLPEPSRSNPDIGSRYQSAVGKKYVQGPLARELFGNFRVTFPWQKHRLRSSLDQISLDYEKQMRGGDIEPKPDYRAEVFGRDPSTGRRAEEPHTVHAIEITVKSEFEDRKRDPQSHKADQLVYTLDEMFRRYPTSKIVYTFVSPREPSGATEKLIQNAVAVHRQNHGIRVVWRVVPY
jgi:hypothetical protein